MIDQQELIFVVDENNQPIEPVLRTKAHAEGIWHRTTDIVVVNSKNEVLCHKRSMLKDTGPGLWDSAFGGHIGPKIEPAAGALAELREESGLQAEIGDLKFVDIFKRDNGNNKEFRYFYVYHWDGDAKDLNFEKDEIDEVKWVGIEILIEEMRTPGKWSPAPYFEALLKLLGVYIS